MLDHSLLVHVIDTDLQFSVNIFTFQERGNNIVFLVSAKGFSSPTRYHSNAVSASVFDSFSDIICTISKKAALSAPASTMGGRPFRLLLASTFFLDS